MIYMEIYNGTYCVYIHTNKVNGKMYVGQTIYGDNPNKRWANGYGYRFCTLFWRSIEKYGWDNFEHEVVASNLTLEEANHFEELLIEQLCTMNPKRGYNLRSGGENNYLSEETKKKIGEANSGHIMSEEQKQKLREMHIGTHLSDEHKQKISEALKGENNPNYGKKMSDEQKRKLSDAHKGKHTGKDNSFYGKHHTKEIKEKIRQARIGNKHSDETKRKISEANKNPSDEVRKKNSDAHKGDKNFKARKVVQLDKEGNFIREWTCMATASNECNVGLSQICWCCKHKPHCKTAGGFQWVYAEEYYNMV